MYGDFKSFLIIRRIIMKENILLKNMRIIDDSSERTGDILITDGVIAAVGKDIPEDKANFVVDGRGELLVIPGLFDMHVHFRDPGLEYKEDILSGSEAALAGGVTGVLCMPNTRPAADNPEIFDYVSKKAAGTGVEVYQAGCITVGMKGEELADYSAYKRSGVSVISDDGRPVESEELLLEALELSNSNGLLVACHCEDLAIIDGGIINKGAVSEKLGVKGMDRESENKITKRDILLAQEANARIHICHVSTKECVDFIKKAKQGGVKVTCETCPHYFMLTEEKLLTKDADYRMNPPLREESDRLAVLHGVLDGTIDCIVTDHAPHARDEKADFLTAPNGVVGLETSLAATLTALYHTGKADLREIITLMSTRPREIMGLDRIRIEEGARANITVVDPELEWTVVPEKLHSKSVNTVFKGDTFKGKVIATVSGEVFRYYETV